MTTKELTALAREAFGEGTKVSHYRAAYEGHFYDAHDGRQYLLCVHGDTRAEAEARFVACLRAIKEVTHAGR